MQSLNIKAEWNYDKTAWVASCDLWGESSIEAATIEELIENIRPLLPHASLTSQGQFSGNPGTVVLTKYWPVSSCISI